MTKTRNLSDLLDANGDVKLNNLDNVPASNDASALTTGTLPIARIADGDITTAKLADSTVSLAKLTATGTKDATTFLRGDNTFASAQGAYESQLLHVRDEKSSSTTGGASSAGDNTRTLNTVVTNEISSASLSSNQITLPAGTYFINASAPIYKSNNHKAYLYNVTDSDKEIIGTVQYSDTSNDIQTNSFVYGRFTITGTKVFEFRQYVSVAKSTNGLGVGYNVDSTINIYANVMIWKVA